VRSSNRRLRRRRADVLKSMTTNRLGKYGDRWSRADLVLALYLYCQIPFAKTKANNAEVMRLADLIGRTPASVARKLGNFGAFDPLLAERGISGLTHTSKDDKLIWDEFRNRWDALVGESARLLSDLSAPIRDRQHAATAQTAEDEQIIVRPTGPSERQASMTVRLFQSFFRRAVLASYDSTCCVCGLNIRQLLVASHIKAWSKNESTRSDPENGLCLCALHDRAFDRGMIAVSEAFQILVHPALTSSRQPFVQAALADFNNQPLRMPTRFAPRREFLAWHMQNVFGREAGLLRAER
jgi:putative restriction endonuclease